MISMRPAKSDVSLIKIDVLQGILEVVSDFPWSQALSLIDQELSQLESEGNEFYSV